MTDTPTDPTDVQLLVIDLVPIDSVSEHPENPRVGNVDKIVESIRAHGQYVPIVVQRSTGYAVKGNHTLRALGRVGASHVNVVYRDYTDEQARRVLLMDNKASDDGYYEDGTLVQMLDELKATEQGLAGTGFTDEDLAAILARQDSDFPGFSPDEAPDDVDVPAQYAVTVICRDTAHQAEVYERLTAEGFVCRVVTV